MLKKELMFPSGDIAMTDRYADDYDQIPAALADNPPLKRRVVALIESERIQGKVLEGAQRTEDFRQIMRELVLGRLNQFQAIRRTSRELPRELSPYSHNNRVFPNGWEERLVRTQLSRFYNQAVLEELMERGVDRCFVPHSSAEASDTPCSTELAGRTHGVGHLHGLLVKSYADGVWPKEPKIPNHPHCTHVIRPL